MPPSAWVQPPSVTLCAGQCGARCCRAPGSVLLSEREANRMAMRLRTPLMLRTIPGDQRARMNFSENGGQCPMLAPDFSCAIYDHRPVACHDFPQAPMAGCLVWPEGETDGIR